MTARRKTAKAKAKGAGHRNKVVARQARAKAIETKAQAELLGEYARKRNFARTAAPKPAPAPYPPQRRGGKAKRARPPPYPSSLEGEGRDLARHDAPLPTP